MVSETDNISNITLPQPGIAHAPSISGQVDFPHAQKNDIVQAAATAVGLLSNDLLAKHWDNSVNEIELAHLVSRSPPSFDSARFDFVHSPLPETQTFRNGNMESTLSHLNTVDDLRQWAEEYEVVDHSQILRRLVALGDSDALIRLQLQGLNDYKSIIERTNSNGITDNVLIREKLLSIVKDYGITIPDNADDCAIWELALLVQNGMLPILSIEPNEVSADQRTDVNVSRMNGSPIRPDMVGRGDNHDQHPVNESHGAKGFVCLFD